MGVIHPKVMAATAVSILVSLVLAALTWVQDNPGVMAPLPLWLQGLILMVIPPLLVFLGGYAKASDPSSPATSLDRDRHPG